MSLWGSKENALALWGVGPADVWSKRCVSQLTPVSPSASWTSLCNIRWLWLLTVAMDTQKDLKCPVFIVWVSLYKVLNTKERGLCIHSNNRTHSSVLSKFSLIRFVSSFNSHNFLHSVHFFHNSLLVSLGNFALCIFKHTCLFLWILFVSFFISLWTTVLFWLIFGLFGNNLLSYNIDLLFWLAPYFCHSCHQQLNLLNPQLCIDIPIFSSSMSGTDTHSSW